MTATATTDLGAALTAAIQGGYVAQLSGQTFTVNKPIVININSTTEGPMGIDLGGATIISDITNGAPVIQIVVGPGVDARYLTLSNFTIQGNGQEGDGIQIVADGNDRWLYNFNVSNVTVNHVGGVGLDVQGSVFEGLVSNSWMTNDGQGGARFANSADGGVASALHWFGGGFQNNAVAGLILDNAARDMSVDGASFTDNHGPGISASQGITSVTSSTFQDNQGDGVWFQNYGNFNDDTFITSGAQTTGISGWLEGNATVINSTSTYTGTGSNPTVLANLQGYGGAFQSGDSGHVTTGSNVASSGPGGGDLAHVSVSTHGVALPSLPAVNAATTAAVTSSTGTTEVETALKASMASGTVVHLSDATTYTVTQPIIINITGSVHGPIGIDLGGAKIMSQITNGGPVIEIVVGPGVDVSRLTLSNFLIEGNGGEGDGIKIIADGADRAINNLNVTNVDVEHVGGIGLDVVGNVSNGVVTNSWMNGNNGGGARFADSAGGGVTSGLEWTGGGFRKNGVAGLILDNGAHDMTVKGAYFVENTGPGLDATSGITLVQESGFENNGGVGAVVQGPSSFVDDTFSTWGVQKVGVGGYLAGGQVNMTGVGAEYYGPGSDPSVIANLQGSGTLAIAGGGSVIAGPNVTVTGGATGPATSPPAAPAPAVTENLLNDTGVSSSDGITSNAALTGTADPNAVVHFTVDGSAIAATATANSRGAWSFTPAGLADGQHTIVASETGAGGTGSASLTFTLDTTAPTVTEKLVSGGMTTANPALTGTADPNAVVHFTVDRHAIAGTATANVSGVWSYTPPGLADGQHTVVASETDVAGNTGSSSLSFTLNTTPPATVPVVTEKLFSDTGTSSSDKITSNSTLAGTADPNAVVHFTVDGSAIAASATANASGAWSFTPTGLADSQHTIVASETDAGGTGSASLSFTLETNAPVPVVTDAVLANGQATVTGTCGEAGDTISLYDGNTWMGFAASDSHGNWSLAMAAAANVDHSYGANATDLAGNEGHSACAFVCDDPTPVVTMPSLTAKLVDDTGASSIDKITADPTLTGTADANAVVHFTVDGSATAATATANASGVWSFTPTGLADGQHIIVASETNAAGNTGEASLAVTLDAHTPIPAITGDVVAHGQVTLSGTTGEANDAISIYDGNSWLGFAATDSHGNWSFTASAPSNMVHSYGANAINLAGNEGHSSGKLILGSSGTDTLVGRGGNDVIVGNGGNDHITGGGGADTLTGGSGNVTFVYNAVTDSRFSASDTITDFHHGADKIDLTNIAGISATNGVAQFQGNITGSGSLTLNAHSVAYLEAGGNTQVLVNTTAAAEAVTSTDTHTADMNITLLGVHLGLTSSDFHHV